MFFFLVSAHFFLLGSNSILFSLGQQNDQHSLLVWFRRRCLRQVSGLGTWSGPSQSLQQYRLPDYFTVGMQLNSRDAFKLLRKKERLFLMGLLQPWHKDKADQMLITSFEPLDPAFDPFDPSPFPSGVPRYLLKLSESGILLSLKTRLSWITVSQWKKLVNRDLKSGIDFKWLSIWNCKRYNFLAKASWLQLQPACFWVSKLSCPTCMYQEEG